MIHQTCGSLQSFFFFFRYVGNLESRCVSVSKSTMHHRPLGKHTENGEGKGGDTEARRRKLRLRRLMGKVVYDWSCDSSRPRPSAIEFLQDFKDAGSCSFTWILLLLLLERKE